MFNVLLDLQCESVNPRCCGLLTQTGVIYLSVIITRGGHKRGILGDFSQHGKFRKSVGNSGQCRKKL